MARCPASLNPHPQPKPSPAPSPGAVAWRELRRRWLRGGSAERAAEGEGAAGVGAADEGGREWSPSAAEPLLYINCGGHEGLPLTLTLTLTPTPTLTRTRTRTRTLTLTR